MPDADLDPSQNPYRSPVATDEDSGKPKRRDRKRTRDLVLVGWFLGLSYGAATGTAITVSLDVMHELVQVLTEPGSFSAFDRIDEWITYYVAVAALGALLGAANGAILGYVQGWLTARKPPFSRQRLRAVAAFCWASVAAAWCLLIDQNMLSSAPRTWMLYLALPVASAAAGCGGAVVAAKLRRGVQD